MMAQYKLKYCLKESFNLKQPANQLYYPVQINLTFFRGPKGLEASIHL